MRVEVLAYAPTAFYHCTHCEVVFHHVGLGEKIHAEQDAAAFPDDLRRQYADLSDWVRRLVDRYCGRVEVKVVDAASLEGFWKALRYRVRRFPAVVVGGRAYPVDGDFARADALVDAWLGSHTGAPEAPGAAGATAASAQGTRGGGAH